MIVMQTAQPVLSVDEQRYIRAMEELAAAEVEEAEAFLTFKFSGHGVSDWTARNQAIAEMKGKVTHLRGMAEVYRSRLGRTDVASAE